MCLYLSGQSDRQKLCFLPSVNFVISLKAGSMTSEQSKAIRSFFNSLNLLKQLNIIRSDVIFGDIGEFLCTIVFVGLQLVREKTNEGFDAILDQKKVQIKFSDSSDAKNIDLGNPDQYEILIIVLGKKSAHRMHDDSDADYLFYKFSSNEVMSKFKVASGYTLSKTKHFKKSEKQFSIDPAEGPI